jgi:Fe-Mn family superoxide dismutase
MAFTLPTLPYAYDALEPYIDAQTMEIHYSKHHNAYLTNLNNALAGTDFADQSLESILTHLDTLPDSIRMVVRNNAGGVYNHNLFWECLSAQGGGEPSGALGDAIAAKFGGFAAFKDLFSKAGLTRFGSGWAWLSKNAAGDLVVTSTPNQDTPLADGLTPLLGLDVWEHAYYLRYQNRRPDYIAAFWHIVNWNVVAARFAA